MNKSVIKVDKLTVTVKYRVGLGELNIPKEVYDQMVKACETGTEINPSEIDNVEVSEWLDTNISERDSMDWEVEIDDIS
jgi:hypothetical protein